jgi:dTDP-4-dehydrorhamnose reductase
MLIIGATGLLGADLARYFGEKYERVAVGSADLDIRHKTAVADFIRQVKPDIVLNAAAWTDVDACQKDIQKAFAINADGAGNIAAGCREAGARLIHYSTDYVFDGRKETPYVEDDPTEAVNVYGQSKIEGERAVLKILPEAVILRVAWLYNNNRKSFITRLVERAKENKPGSAPIRMITDQIGTPTWNDEVVRQTEVVIDKKLTGIIHCTAEGACSRYDQARLLFTLLNLDVPIIECRRGDFPDRAPRPAYTPLANGVLDKAGCNIMKDYGSALRDFIKSAGFNEL